jgi:hypothetical protein
MLIFVKIEERNMQQHLRLLGLCTCVCVRACVCMHVRLYIYVCVCVCMYVCTYTGMYVYMHAYIHVCNVHTYVLHTLFAESATLFHEPYQQLYFLRHMNNYIRGINNAYYALYIQLYAPINCCIKCIISIVISKLWCQKLCCIVGIV